MSRVFNPDSAGKERARLSKSIVLALRELMRLTEPNDTAHDLAAFIALALTEINETVETSVAAWEKRGYWVKADRFRLDWEWSGRLGTALRQAVLAEDWATVAGLSAQAGQKLAKVTVPARHRLGTPWVGAWKQLKQG